MIRTESKLDDVRASIRKQMLSKKFSDRRLMYGREEAPTNFKQVDLKFFLGDKYFASSSSKVFQTLEDYEITKSAFKSDSDYMVTQDRNGFILVKDGQVTQIRSSGIQIQL